MNEYPVKNIRVKNNEWKIFINTFICQRTTNQILRELELPRCRVLKMLSHLRAVMSLDVPTVFNGPVEMDETYIGGQRKNKKLHIRRIKAKRGHGTEKLPIVGIFDRSSGQVVVMVEPKKLDIIFIIEQLTRLTPKGATVYTDGYKMYRMLPRFGFKHEYVDHDGDELVRGDVHTNNIEGFWGILKRKLGCIGGIRRTKLPLFVGELAWRFNCRKMSSAEQSERLFKLLKDT